MALPFCYSHRNESADTMIIKRIPQPASPQSSSLYHLEKLQRKTIDPGLDPMSQVPADLEVPQPAPFVFTVRG